mmetsp:Transcript_17308/g.49426  ORF Transcript_17308/g.49426 Transcript_17308/m.49426 type:complete len:940 (+) Transcript_17308:574-3393(+)
MHRYAAALLRKRTAPLLSVPLAARRPAAPLAATLLTRASAHALRSRPISVDVSQQPLDLLSRLGGLDTAAVDTMAYGDDVEDLLNNYPTEYRDALAHHREHGALPGNFNLPRAFDWAEPYMFPSELGSYATSDERRDGSQYFSGSNYIRLTTRSVDAGHDAFNRVLRARKDNYIATRNAEKAAYDELVTLVRRAAPQNDTDARFTAREDDKAVIDALAAKVEQLGFVKAGQSPTKIPPEEWTAVQRKAAGFLGVPSRAMMLGGNTHCVCEAGHGGGGLHAFAMVMGDDAEARAEGIEELRLLAALIMFYYNRMNYKASVPASALRAVAAATTEDAVDNARMSNVGSDIVQLQLRHNVSLRAPKAISAWQMDRAEFLERFYDASGPYVTLFGRGITNGGTGALCCSCCCVACVLGVGGAVGLAMMALLNRGPTYKLLTQGSSGGVQRLLEGDDRWKRLLTHEAMELLDPSSGVCVATSNAFNAASRARTAVARADARALAQMTRRGVSLVAAAVPVSPRRVAATHQLAARTTSLARKALNRCAPGWARVAAVRAAQTVVLAGRGGGVAGAVARALAAGSFGVGALAAAADAGSQAVGSGSGALASLKGAADVASMAFSACGIACEVRALTRMTGVQCTRDLDRFDFRVQHRRLTTMDELDPWSWRTLMDLNDIGIHPNASERVLVEQYVNYFYNYFYFPPGSAINPGENDYKNLLIGLNSAPYGRLLVQQLVKPRNERDWPFLDVDKDDVVCTENSHLRLLLYERLTEKTVEAVLRDEDEWVLDNCGLALDATARLLYARRGGVRVSLRDSLEAWCRLPSGYGKRAASKFETGTRHKDESQPSADLATDYATESVQTLLRYVRAQVKATIAKLVLPYFDEVDEAVLSLMKNPRFQPKDDAGREYQRRHLARLGDKEHQRARDNLVALAATSEYVAGSKED